MARLLAWLRGSVAAQGGLVFVGASLAVGLSNFVFHLVLSRLLGPANYGAFGALLNVTAVATVPLNAVSVTVAQSVARRPDPAQVPPLGRLLRLAVVAGALATALWLAATPTLDRFFHLRTPDATVVLGFWLLVAVPGAVLEGVVLGQRRFAVAGAGQLAGTLVRLTSGVALVLLGLGVEGGMAATVAAALAIVAAYGWALRRELWARGRFVPRASEALLSTVALGGAALLTSIDAWLARHFLAPHAAGLFVAAATAGNIALFLPGAITLVYFPRLAASRGSGPEARQALARATGLVALVGLGSAGVMALFPGLVVGVLFGPAFANARGALGLVALADAGIAVAGCFVYYQVARGSPLALAAWPTCLAALGLAAAFHDNIEVLAWDMVAASGALVVGLGVPTLVTALRSLAEDSSSLPRQAILLQPAELDLTVVVPCRNVGAERLAGHLQAIARTLEDAGVRFEIVPVSDGSTDDSADAFRQLPPALVRPIVWAENRGKGEALRAGLAVGRGRYLGFIDGDGDLSPELLAGFVDHLRQAQPELVVGSKRHPAAAVHYPPLRRLYSQGYQLLTGALFGLRVRDTQTGIKLVRRDVVAEVLPRMVEKRFAFDLELLAVAHRLGYRDVAELPVVIGERFPSTISPRAVWRMLQDTLAVFWRLRVLGFYDPPLAEPRSPSLGTRPAWDLAGRLAAGERLRILVCNWRDLAHPRAGGAEVYTHRVARAWVAAGHEVTWFCAAAPGRPSFEEVDGIRIVRRGGALTVYREARRYYRRIGAGRFDLLVDEVNTRPFGAAQWAGTTPVVALAHQVAKEVWFHELPWPLAVLGRYFLEPIWLRRLRRVPVLTVSDSSAASLAAFGLTDVAVVPEGVDPVERPAVEREPVPTVVWVGRLSPNKRPDHAVEAFRRLRASLPDARLWLIGSGPMEEALRAALPPGATLLGRVSEVEKRERLARAHCLIATSVREGWGLTVTEAAQVGTPAVAYDVAGLRDSVAASGGVLIPPSPNALADALAACLPRWATAPPTVEAGGVEPWPVVADLLLRSAASRASARRRRAEAGEDVAVAWRQAAVRLGALVDRRVLGVLGVACVVALAPLVEVGARGVAEAVAGGAVACLALAAVGAWAEAVRWPLLGRVEGPGVLAEGHGAAPTSWPSWWGVLVGALAAGAVQLWVRGLPSSGRSVVALGGRFGRELGAAFRPDRPTALAAALNLPVDAVGSLLRLVGVGALGDERLWAGALAATAALAMFWLLRTLGLREPAAATGAVVYLLNPYVAAMSGSQPSYLAAMAVVPGVVAWLLRAAEEDRLGWRKGLWALPLAILLGLVAQSPPLLLACGAAALGGVLLVGWLRGRFAARAAFRRGVIVGALALCLSAYWAAPLGLQLATSSLVHQAASEHWGWAAQRASLVDGLWLNTAFDFRNPVRFPHGVWFVEFPLVLWRYALPIGVLAATSGLGLQARRRGDQQRLRILAAALVVTVLVTVVSTANHLPGAPIFALMTALPGGWLFEDPGRFLFLAAGAEAAILALGAEEWAVILDRTSGQSLVSATPPSRRAPRVRSRLAWQPLTAAILAVMPFCLVGPGHLGGAIAPTPSASSRLSSMALASGRVDAPSPPAKGRRS